MTYRVHPDGSIEAATLEDAVALSRTLVGKATPTPDTGPPIHKCNRCGMAPAAAGGWCSPCIIEVLGPLALETAFPSERIQAGEAFTAVNGVVESAVRKSIEHVRNLVEVSPDETAPVGSPGWWEAFYRKHGRDPTPAEMSEAGGRPKPMVPVDASLLEKAPEPE
jgi:hypothetical protein